MKKLCFSGIFVLILFGSGTIAGQELDQHKLMNGLIGTWQATTGKDTAQM